MARLEEEVRKHYLSVGQGQRDAAEIGQVTEDTVYYRQAFSGRGGRTIVIYYYWSLLANYNYSLFSVKGRKTVTRIAFIPEISAKVRLYTETEKC